MSLKQPRILFAVAVIAAAAAYWFFVLSPKRDEAKQVSAQVTAQEAAITQAQTTLQAYRQAKSAYPGNYAAITHLGKAVPADDDVRSLVVQLQAAASKVGVDFRSIEANGGAGASTDTAPTPGVAAPPPGAVAVGSAGFSAMPFSLEFRGEYLKLASLFTKLDSFVRVHNDNIAVNGRLLRVDAIELSPQESQSGSTDLTATVTVSTYLVPSSGSGATPATPVPSTTTPTTTTDGGTTAATTSATTGALR